MLFHLPYSSNLSDKLKAWKFLDVVIFAIFLAKLKRRFKSINYHYHFLALANLTDEWYRMLFCLKVPKVSFTVSNFVIFFRRTPVSSEIAADRQNNDWSLLNKLLNISINFLWKNIYNSSQMYRSGTFWPRMLRRRASNLTASKDWTSYWYHMRKDLSCQKYINC